MRAPNLINVSARVYLPRDLVEDTAFPFPTEKSVKVKIRFMPGNRKLIIEEYQQNIKP